MRALLRRLGRALADVAEWLAYALGMAAFGWLGFHDVALSRTATLAELTFTALCAFAAYYAVIGAARYWRTLRALRASGTDGDRRDVASVSWEWALARAVRLVFFAALGLLSLGTPPPALRENQVASQAALAGFLLLAGLDAVNTYRQERVRRAFDRRVRAGPGRADGGP